MRKEYDYCITGATGLVGSNLADRILADRPGSEIVCLVRASSDVSHLRTTSAKIRVVDFNDPGTIMPYVAASQKIYHLIGLTASRDPEAFKRVNAELPAVFLDAYLKTRGRGSAFVFMSSLAAVGPRDPGHDDPLRLTGLAPVTEYGRTKLAGEKLFWPYIEDEELNIKIVRSPSVYGNRDKDMRITFDMAGRGIAPVVGKGGRVTVVNVKDLARYMLRLGDEGVAPGIYYPYDGRVYTQRELFGIAAEAQGRQRVFVVRVPVWAARAAALFNEKRGKNPIFNREKVREIAAPDWGYEGEGFSRIGLEPEYDLYEGVKDLYSGKKDLPRGEFNLK